VNVGDLVICKYVEGKPVGVILNVRWRKVGTRGARAQVYDVFMEGDTYPFQAHLVESVNECR
jgi:hypothetical protein